ncbi:hypothetical protein F5Y02DRAFT_420480 [Annulohypoxylon stygium]|nr:hypothetical protein F5Y02DRAFT_420480 [Annulohypoxylon stygium]
MPSNNIEGAGNGKAPRPKGNQVRFTPIRRSSTPLAPTLSVSPTGMQQRKRLMPTFSDYELYKKQLSEANLQQAQVGSNVGSVSALDATPYFDDAESFQRVMDNVKEALFPNNRGYKKMKVIFYSIPDPRERQRWMSMRGPSPPPPIRRVSRASPTPQKAEEGLYDGDDEDVDDALTSTKSVTELLDEMKTSLAELKRMNDDVDER